MPIFIIDDHPLMREAISLLLKRLSTPATVVELDRLAAVAAAVAQHVHLNLFVWTSSFPTRKAFPASSS